MVVERRTFIALAGIAAAWPIVARAQRSLPVIGLLRSTPSELFGNLVVAFRQGLNENGFIEGQSIAIEQRWADNNPDRLRDFAADLVRHQVAVIVANSIAAEVAKEKTSSIPIVFVSGDDPIKAGLVTSLNHPGGNLTGVTFFGGGYLDVKRLELLRDLVPNAVVVAVLLDPNYTRFVSDLPELEAASQAMGRKLMLVRTTSEREFESAFASISQARAGALLVSGSPFFTSQRERLVALSAHHRIPTIYDQKDFVSIGGLMSYATSFTDAYHQAGVYAGRILKGVKPGDLPVVQPTKFELVVNIKTAKALAVDVPATLLVAADEVVE